MSTGAEQQAVLEGVREARADGEPARATNESIRAREDAEGRT